MAKNQHTGFAIVLAWPQTKCKQAGAWYDVVMRFFRFNKDGYYTIGHAAVVLVDDQTKRCNYFDFGRYHAPSGHGRVRSAETDHDLEIKTKAKFSENSSISNLKDILIELYPNKSTHGTGVIMGSSTRINFNAALQKVSLMQENEHWAYGPFVLKGTNCSRFVRTIILAGKPSFFERLKFFFPLTISPSPRWNLRATNNSIIAVGKNFQTNSKPES